MALKDFYEWMGGKFQVRTINREQYLRAVLYNKKRSPTCGGTNSRSGSLKNLIFLDKDARRHVYTDELKLHLLNKKPVPISSLP